jgi:DNA-binding Lrp family transcriptional regulator
MVLEPSMRKTSSLPVNKKKAQAIKLITELGPQVTEIASRIGVHKETVRYWYHRLLERGFTVQASYDFEKLDMKRIVMLVDLDDALKEHAQTLFIAMNKICYVVSYERIIPEGIYRLTVSVPSEFIDEYIAFAQALQEKGLFKSLEIFTFETFRNVPMRTNFYNFETEVWDFDWSSPVPDSSDVLMQATSEKGRFDMLDLFILQELRVDANRSLVEIQENLRKNNNMDVNYKTLDWHYRLHVLGGGLIKSYIVNWMGTSYSFEYEKAMHRKHKYLRVDLIVRDVTENEKMHLLGAMNGLPFQWSEAVGLNYFTNFAFPSENITEAFLYLEKVLAPMKNRARYFIMDQADALTFYLEPSLYDETTRSWKFDRPALTAKFENMILQIKRGAG